MSIVRASNRKNPSARPLRSDPKPRHIDGSANWMRLKNANPEKKYVFANRLDALGGLNYYLSLGYEVEQSKPGGVKLAVGRVVPDGQEIEHAGSVLVSIDRERWEEIQRVGPDGQSGSEYVDQIESRIVRNGGVEDPLRGISKRWMSMVNKVTELEVERS